MSNISILNFRWWINLEFESSVTVYLCFKDILFYSALSALGSLSSLHEMYRSNTIGTVCLTWLSRPLPIVDLLYSRHTDTHTLTVALIYKCSEQLDLAVHQPHEWSRCSRVISVEDTLRMWGMITQTKTCVERKHPLTLLSMCQIVECYNDLSYFLILYFDTIKPNTLSWLS